MASGSQCTGGTGMSWTGRSTLVVIAMCAALGVACSSAAAEATPLPHVTGPLPVTATSYPFGAADHTLVPEDLSKVGYVEDEYLVSGKANVYTWPAPGPAVVRTPDAPYTTRILVRRPAKASRFSGNATQTARRSTPARVSSAGRPADAPGAGGEHEGATRGHLEDKGRHRPT